MSCSDYKGCEECGCVPTRGKECHSSKTGYHCWHHPQSYNNGYGATTTGTVTVFNDPVCCFCGTKESQMHGPYHPLNSLKWNTTTVGPVWMGGSGTATVTFTTGSAITERGTPYAYPSTTGFITTNPTQGSLTWDSNTCVGGITFTGNGRCTNSPGSASFGSCPNGCNGTTTGCPSCPPKL